MDCREARSRLSTSVDGELDLVRQVDLEEHLRACADCRLASEGVAARKAAIGAGLARHRAPQALEWRIRSALAAEAGAARPSRWRGRGWRALGLAAGLGAAALGGFEWGGASARADRLLDEAVEGHVRSLEAGHLTDVLSTDRHTVKPWFLGKLNFSPPVADLAADGFPLVGGRLDYLDGRPVAALVFHRKQHSVNLFVWNGLGSPAPRPESERAGFRTVGWALDGLCFLAVSDIPSSDLQQFAEAFRRETR
jgi:anti-sigma factor RsiW